MRHRAPSRQGTRGAQLLALGVEVETVARLHFDRGHAFGDQGVQPPQGRIDERLFARRARRSHRREDSAAGPGDLVVARAAQAELEFVRAIAGMDQVGVTVDQPRSDPAASSSRCARTRRDQAGASAAAPA